VKVYFATPYHSWERNSNENFNGLLRQYLRKGTCMTHGNNGLARERNGLDLKSSGALLKLWIVDSSDEEAVFPDGHCVKDEEMNCRGFHGDALHGRCDGQRST
jgi:hypothetical protein